MKRGLLRSRHAPASILAKVGNYGLTGLWTNGLILTFKLSDVARSPFCVSMSNRLPDIDIHLPLPENILRFARAAPSRRLGFILSEPSPDARPVLLEISWRRALLDIRRRAKELVSVSGRPPRNPGEDPFVVGLLLRNGYNYFLTLTATIMLRWTPLVLSPRNSPSGIVHLMRSAHSAHLIVDSDLLSFAESLAEPSFHIIQTADTVSDDDVDGDNTDNLWADYPTAQPEALSMEAGSSIFAFLHTSGSTGHPKTILYRHQWFLAICAAHRRQRPQSIGCTYYTIMPLFHGIGILLTYIFSLGLAGRVHFLNLRQPPTAVGVLRHLALHGDQALEILLPPSILESIVDGQSHEREEGLKILSRASIVLVAGAPLRKEVGDFVVKSGVPLQNHLGMTETGPLGLLTVSNDRSNWEYMMFDDMYRYFFKPIDGKVKEMIVLPSECAPCVINHRDPEGFSTSDLWEQHPEKPHLWRIVGRTNDITVLSNGEKTNNQQLQTLLCDSPFIHSATIFGAGRFLNGAIVCPPAPLSSYAPESVSAYLDTIWPHITENVNPIVPQHSRLIRPLVLVAVPTKPFVLTDKQSLNRKVTLTQYDDEIAAAYALVEKGGYEEVVLPPAGLAAHDTDGIMAYIQAVVQKVLQRGVAPDTDLFDAGLESLMAMRVRSAVLAALKKSGKSVTVPRNIVYTLPTQAALAGYLRAALVSEAGLGIEDADMQSGIVDTVDAYTVDFPTHQPVNTAGEVEGDIYAVTGTTGSLGSFLVSLLLSKPEVRKIYLLNRKSDTKSIKERHKSAFCDRGLDYELLSQAVSAGRAVHVDVALGEKNLALPEGMYDKLRMGLTHIVHCAWPVNFSLMLPSFQTHIRGVRNLIDLALSSTRTSPAHLTFLSSIAVVALWDGPRPVPEVSLDTPATCLNLGYAHAKYVSEKIIKRAVAARPGFKATIIRSGQISGAEGTGAWPRTEHIPTLIKSCVDFGLVPDGFPAVRWLPVNIAAQVLYAMIRASVTAAANVQPAFYNLENAISTPWSLVARTLSKVYALPIVPPAQWLECGVGMPTLGLHHAREAAGGLVDYVVKEELVKVYASYACR
ncbi:acetyl-CoA synthetase-like protein [Mycena rebaudengoi]|nr:acetyl-CoA synthetase-like protein [Mycena rebaudengoi]